MDDPRPDDAPAPDLAPDAGKPHAPAGAAGSRDMYGRKPTSTSRGKTQQRIMDLQHAKGTLPGANELLADAPTGSIGAALVQFHRKWVERRPVTARRSYERSLVLLARDLAAGGPALAEPASRLDSARLAAHLAWRVTSNLDHPGELVRCTVHLARLADWLDEHYDTGIAVDRDALRDLAERLAHSDE